MVSKSCFLSILYSIISLPISAKAAIPFGHLGPEGTVLFLNGFHFLSDNTHAEISADHYCAIITNDFLQCVVYNTATTPTRLAGIEYIISGTAFSTLDYEERQLWHSHSFEVTSGFLIEPNMPASADHAIMEILAGTYGKTFHTWRYDQINSSLPLGIPEIVMGFTGSSQITPDFVTERDKLFGVNTTAIRESRADIVPPEVIEGADSWRNGYILTLGLLNTTMNLTFG